MVNKSHLRSQIEVYDPNSTGKSHVLPCPPKNTVFFWIFFGQNIFKEIPSIGGIKFKFHPGTSTLEDGSTSQSSGKARKPRVFPVSKTDSRVPQTKNL